MTDIYVANASQLQTALAQAKGGETIILKSGNYGALDIVNESYSSYVTLVSEQPLGAHFNSVTIDNSDFIRIDSVHVDSPSNGGPGGRIVEIIKGSSHIEFLNSEVNGKVDSYYEGFYGLYSKDSSNLTFAGNYVHDVKVGGAFFKTTALDVTGNTIDYVAGDSFKFSTVRDAIIEGNVGARNVISSPGEHYDFIQFQHDSSDIVVRGNISMPETRGNVQGIFLKDGIYSDVLVEYNVISSSQVNGLFVSDGSSNMVARYNTLVNIPGSHNITIERGFDQSYNNITTTSAGNAGLGSNLNLQNTDPNKPFYYGDYFANPEKGLARTLEDLLPQKGSAAETMGAVGTVEAFLAGNIPTPAPRPDPAPQPAPQPAPEPDPEPQPAPTPGTLENAAFYLEGDYEISGARDVIEYGHNSDLELSEATVAFTFNADTVSGYRGLLSKDASHFQGGGNHFTSFIKDGVLTLRFQDGADSKTITVNGIKANTDYDLQFSFGDGEITVWLDGNKVGAADFDTSWATNREFMQLGGNGWASNSGQAGFTHAFDGTLSDLVIVEGVLSPAALKTLVAGEPVAPPQPAPDPQPQPAPEPEQPGDPAYMMTGAQKISASRDVIEVAPTAALALASATAALTFNADSVSGKKGLLSKDASYFQGGGHHFTSYIDNGKLIVRFQDGSTSETFDVSGIQAGRDYDFQISFGDGQVTAMLDGKVFGQAAFNMSWVTNAEYMQIGANGWASGTGEAGFKHVFDGTISDVVVVEGVHSSTDIKAILDASPPPQPTPAPMPSDAPIFFLNGAQEIATSQDVLEYAHDTALEVPVGTAMLTFNADIVSGRKGLLSKDASHYDGGGNHFTSYIQNGKLVVRFQDGDSTKVFKTDAIEVGVDHDLQITFGDGWVSAMLDGNVFGEGAFDIAWDKNVEHMQIGANGWASDTGEAGFKHVFQGTISDVMLVAGRKSPEEMEAIKALYGATDQTDFRDLDDLLLSQEFSSFDSVAASDDRAPLSGPAWAPETDEPFDAELLAAVHGTEQDYYNT
ncbi:MAG: right-handed parallel beta-helix repeat-containing protein [Pseudomonadota bacterium]